MRRFSAWGTLTAEEFTEDVGADLEPHQHVEEFRWQLKGSVQFESGNAYDHVHDVLVECGLDNTVQGVDYY
jgi:hypothetical protein